MNRLKLYALLGGLACTCSKGQDLQSIDFTPVDETTWSAPTVRLDFGPGIGYGSVIFTSLNGGSFSNLATPYPYTLPSSTLSTGAVFTPGQSSVFEITAGASTGLSGVTMSVALDSGVFPANSYFSVTSLGASGANSQYVQPVSGLAAPDPAQLPTDGPNNVNWALLDPSSNLYGAAANTSASKGLAMEISGDSFSVNLLTTPGYDPGGVAMTIVTPVPEASGATMIGLAAALGLARRRR